MQPFGGQYNNAVFTSSEEVMLIIIITTAVQSYVAVGHIAITSPMVVANALVCRECWAATALWYWLCFVMHNIKHQD